MRDEQRHETVWENGKRRRLPHFPYSGRRYLWVAIPVVGLTTSALVGTLTSSSAPPPPAPFGFVAAPTSEPEPSDAPSVTELPAPVDPPTPICRPRGVGTGVTAPPAGASASMIAYGSAGSIWLYDVKENAVHRLVKGDWETCGYSNPEFIDRRTIEFAGPTYTSTIDIVTGKIRNAVFHLPTDEWTATVSYSEDHRFLAKLIGGSKDFRLTVSDRSTVLFTKHLGYVCGCDGAGFGWSALWTRDAHLLLVTVPTGNGSRVYVFDHAGRQVVHSIEGGDASWIGATHAFIVHEGSYPGIAWSEVNADTGTKTHLFSSSSLFSPQVSPGGSRIAFTDLQKRRVAVFDMRARTFRTYARGYGYPLWLDDDVFLESGIKTCTCEGTGFDLTGVVYAVNTRTGVATRLRLKATTDADVLF
jgi:hypothetical protein